MHTSFKNVVLKIILPVVGIILAIVAATCGYNVINNQAPESRSQQQMVVAPVATATPAPVVVTPAPAAEETEAVQAEVTPAPVATNAPVSTDAPEAFASVNGVPTPASDEDVIVLSSSSELKLVGTTGKGKPYTYAILESDLKNVNYKKVLVVDENEGYTMAFNSERLLCSLWGKKMPKGYSAKDMPKNASGWLNQDGAVEAAHVRNGWDKSGRNEGRVLMIENPWIIQIEGEENQRVVVTGIANGSSSSSSGSTNNGGSSSSTPVVTPEATPVVTPEATPVVTPEATPEATPVAPTPNPTLRPRVEVEVEATPVAPTPNPTLRPRVEVEAVASTPVVEVQPNPVEAETSTPVVEAQPNPGLRGR